MSEWRPGPSGNRVQDEANRKAFDYIYELRGRNGGTGTRPKAAAAAGMTCTANFIGGFKVGGTTYYNMTFKNGLLVGMS